MEKQEAGVVAITYFFTTQVRSEVCMEAISGLGSRRGAKCCNPKEGFKALCSCSSLGPKHNIAEMAGKWMVMGNCPSKHLKIRMGYGRILEKQNKIEV